MGRRGVGVAVIGAGPAGLAVGGALAARGIRATLYERDEPGAAWRHHYERLHLHTIRSLSGLPGRGIPRRYGRYVAREDLVRYLDDYREQYALDVRSGATIERLERAPEGYRLDAETGSWGAARVVIATGGNHTPAIPAWDGVDRFGGPILHASAYRDAVPFRGLDMLVVGVGNSGAEIATDLVEGGAGSVALAVRTPPHVVPRQALGLPAQVVGAALERLPTAAGDAITTAISRLFVGDLRRHGLPRAADGVVSRSRARGAVPVLDVGLARCLKAGRIRIVPPVESLLEGEARLIGGERIAVDAIVAATGYTTGLVPLVGSLGVLDRRGAPLVSGAATAPGLPGLHFIGFVNPLGGSLRLIARQAREIAASVASGGSGGGGG